MNGDLISREALKKAITEATYNFEQIPIRVDKVQEIIDNAPTVSKKELQKIFYETAEKPELKELLSYECGKTSERPQGEWIPVSERLPDAKTYVLTTTMYQEVYCDYWNGVEFERTETVIAWQPLPDPYKKGGAE